MIRPHPPLKLAWAKCNTLELVVVNVISSVAGMEDDSCHRWLLLLGEVELLALCSGPPPLLLL